MATGRSDRADGTPVNRDHRARDVGRGGGEQERGGPAELLGLAVPAQRDVLGQAGPHLIGIAERASSSRTLSVAILTGSSPLIRIPAGPSSPARVFTTPASPGNSPLEMASSASGTRTDEARTKTIEAPAPVREPVTTSLSLPRPVGRENAGQPDGAEEDALERGPPRFVGRCREVPDGDPPTLISAPSRRPKRSLAAAISRSGWPDRRYPRRPRRQCQPRRRFARGAPRPTRPSPRAER